MPDNEKDIIAALDALSRTAPGSESDPVRYPTPAAKPQRPVDPPPPRRTAIGKVLPSQPADRSQAPPDDAKKTALRRCLACGYPLQPETDFRCSECGRQWVTPILERWFDGAERRRFSEALWLIKVFLVVQLCGLPEAIGLTALGYQAYRVWDLLSIGVAGWALIVANGKRWQEAPSRYGIIGTLILGVAVVFLCWNTFVENADVQNRVLCTLLAVVAPLLILALVNDPPEFFSGPAARRWLVPVAILIGCSLSWLPLISDDWLPLPTAVSAVTGTSALVLTLSVLPRLVLLALWLLAWWWIRRVSRALFEPLPRNARA